MIRRVQSESVQGWLGDEHQHDITASSASGVIPNGALAVSPIFGSPLS